jgi:hypothetical protein
VIRHHRQRPFVELRIYRGQSGQLKRQHEPTRPK